MPGSPKRMDADVAWKFHRPAYQVMYLAKRAAYEFLFAIPEDRPLIINADQALLQIRFKDQLQAQDIVLSLRELEDFYEGLSQLVEYIRAERQKHCRDL